jgi:hypothetical protein
MNEVIKDYLWTFELEGINNNQLYKTCVSVENFLKKKLDEPVYNNYGNFTAYNFRNFNLFLFACPELHKLYKQISIKVSTILDSNKLYYIRCWPNLFREGNNIDWHSHYEPEFKAYHGFYCVNTQGINSSYTDYRILDYPETRVISKDSLLVFGKSDGDTHRSSKWNNSDKYRVTIAFDIMLGESLRPYEEYLEDYNYINCIPILNIK